MLHALLATTALLLPTPADPAALAKDYAAAVKALNDAHVAKPAAKSEEELAKKLPAGASKALAELVKSKDAPGLAAALVVAGEAALDLDRMDDFETVRVRLLKVAPDDAKALGIALSRSRFVARGTDGVEAEGLKALADAFDAVLDGYADVFGLTNFSKVPGKKLRLRAHLVPVITKPPHFAPQFAWHSEIDFPVVDARGFSSPTEQGQFLFYGLCHELGHVIAMWGDTKDEEDRHAWAHYTGVVLVEELSKRKLPALEKARDGKWRSLAKEREELVKEPVEAKERERWKRMKAFVGVHDLVGARAVGEAINAMEAAGKVLRVNRVRYYRVGDFEEAVCATEAGRKKVKELRGVIGGK